MNFDQVSVIAHSDWSKNPAKRRMAVAILQPDLQWLVCEPINIPNPSGYFHSLQSLQMVAGCILAGFDFPIGIPCSYASKLGITDFLWFLTSLSKEKWDQFYTPAEFRSQISLYRPFYPARPGNSKRWHLEQALAMPFSQLYRLCEISHNNRRAACPLFWTMGGSQVGKAAISGWRDLLSPALADPCLDLQIWPFSGTLADLCQPGRLVVVETYPAEFYHHLGLSFSFPTRRSKRRQADRLAFSSQLITWASENNLELPESIITLIQQGFGNRSIGEDQFDALVGLYGMINIVLGHHTAWEPQISRLRNVEGWIFGQSQPREERIIIGNFP
jgi:hypothetical protein